MGFKYKNSRTAAENAILDYLNRRLDDAQLYFDIYDNYEALKEVKVLPGIISDIEEDSHHGTYVNQWEVEEEDLKEYQEDV